MSDTLAQRLPDGRIRIPVVQDLPDGGLAHGSADIGPDDSRYDRYDLWLRQQERADTGR